MSKHLFLFLFMLWLGASGHIASQPIVENDVIISNALPDWGTICTETNVHGGPGENYSVLYSVSIGDKVRIHDQSRPDGTWVSIKSAHWVPLKNLC